MKTSMLWLIGNMSWQGGKQDRDRSLEHYDFNVVPENAHAGELDFQMFADEEPQLAMITENEE